MYIKRNKYIANFTFSTLKASLNKRRPLLIQPLRWIRKYVSSRVKTFVTVAVQTAERTASELACEQAPGKGGKRIQWG